VIYAVYVHVNWSALQMGFYLCITCHTVQWRGKKNFHMKHVHITRREGIRTHVRSDKDAMHIAPTSDITGFQNSVATAQLCRVENAYVTGIVCDICRHEIMWLTAACFGHWFFACPYRYSYLKLFDQLTGDHIATGSGVPRNSFRGEGVNKFS
jgi:hypothetical protein